MSNIDKVNVGGTEYGIEGVSGDSKDDTTTFTSSDVADGSATSWTSVSKLNSGETHSSIFAKVSQMFKNIRYLYKILGNTDISSLGSGTVTSALTTLNTSLGNKANTSDLATVATSGSYSDLSNKPTIPSYGVVSSSSNGLAPKVTNTSGYLKGDGTWSVPTASVPLATSSVRGGAKVGFTESGKNYPVELDSNERMFVNVPWTDTNTTYTGLPDVYVVTAAATQTKVGTSPNYVLRSGSRFTVRIKNANSYNGLIKLNINSTGEKNVYINGAVSSSSNKTLPAGDYSVYYDGSYYYFNTSDEITSLNSALTTVSSRQSYGNIQKVLDTTNAVINVRYNDLYPAIYVALRTTFSTETLLATIATSTYYPLHDVTIPGNKGGYCYINSSGEIRAKGVAWEVFTGIYPKVI